MKTSTRYCLIIISFFFIFTSLIQSVSAGNQITVEFFYNINCQTCIPKLDTYRSVNKYYEKNYEKYNETIIFLIKDISSNRTYRKEYLDYAKNYGIGYPVVIVSNETNLTLIPKADITWKFLNETIGSYLAGLKINETDTPWSLKITIPMSKVLEKTSVLRNFSLILGIISMIILLGTLYFIIKRQINPINKIKYLKMLSLIPISFAPIISLLLSSA